MGSPGIEVGLLVDRLNDEGDVLDEDSKPDQIPPELSNPPDTGDWVT